MNILASLLEDIGPVVSTGTGASFSPGQGEQIASPFVFGSKKKKKRLTIRKKLMEAEVAYTPEKRKELYERYLKEYDGWKDKATRYINAFEGYDLASIIEDKGRADKFYKLGEQMYEQLGKIEDMLDDISYQYEEDGDRQMQNSCSGLSAKYYQLKQPVDTVYDAFGDVKDALEYVVKKGEFYTKER